MSLAMSFIGIVIASVAALVCIVLAVREMLTFLPEDIAALRHGRSTMARIVRTCLWMLGSCIAVASMPATAAYDGSLGSWILHVGPSAAHWLFPIACIAVVLALLAIPTMIAADRQSITAHGRRSGRGASYGSPGMDPAARGRFAAISGGLLGTGGAYATERLRGDRDWRWWGNQDDSSSVARYSSYAGEDTRWSGHDASESAVDTGSSLMDRFTSWLDSSSHQAIDSTPVSSGTDIFGDSNWSSRPFGDGRSCSSHDSSSTCDWSNAWGTANEHQIPAESDYTHPSHDFTTTTYGDHSSWDSSSSDSSSWSSWD